MWTPNKILERIANRSLLAGTMFDDLDPDDALDARGNSFDDDWIRAAEAVQAAWEASPSSARANPAIDAVRESAFKRTFNASGGNHDLAATVSDDFEIICKRNLLGLESPFVTKLEEAYEKQQIPH
jgi:hypothetical protein